LKLKSKQKPPNRGFFNFLNILNYHNKA